MMMAGAIMRVDVMVVILRRSCGWEAQLLISMNMRAIGSANQADRDWEMIIMDAKRMLAIVSKSMEIDFFSLPKVSMVRQIISPAPAIRPRKLG
ncbi:hypothetical protein M911_01695 [Ectothiorhodospira haloalkaliphila]|uniref:Uncharacterized protein n=1 Tax=Ectothiorhodospira haloalkaliphila TaxID=421628 RepID=W8L9T0_9GAMM|nr:hypothetical protein M911_01695 [Ectothiorhodospira haloalkaliphila]